MKIFELINKNLQSPFHFNFLRKTEGNKNIPIITISREKGAGGRIIAAKLAKKLGRRWDYYHRDIVDKIAEQTNITPEQVKKVDEKDISYLEGILGSWVGQEYLSMDNYAKSLMKVLADIGKEGYAIIVGRGANFLFKDALKIRVIADEEQRIKWVMAYEKLSKKQAADLIKKSDANRKNFVVNLYGQDPENPKHYDLVIKTGNNLGVDEAVDLIARLAIKRFHL